jgi:hypothetical protein
MEKNINFHQDDEENEDRGLGTTDEDDTSGHVHTIGIEPTFSGALSPDPELPSLSGALNPDTDLPS